MNIHLHGIDKSVYSSCAPASCEDDHIMFTSIDSIPHNVSEEENHWDWKLWQETN